MKRKVITLALIAIIPLTVFAFPGEGRFQQNHEKRIEKLATKLNLSDSQKTQVKEIFQTQHEKIKAIREETRSRLQVILTPEQMEEMDKMKERRHEKWQQKRQEWRTKRKGNDDN